MRDTQEPFHTDSLVFCPPNRTVIFHTKTLDPSRPVTFVTNSNYKADLGVSPGVSTLPLFFVRPPVLA